TERRGHIATIRGPVSHPGRLGRGLAHRGADRRRSRVRPGGGAAGDPDGGWGGVQAAAGSPRIKDFAQSVWHGPPLAYCHAIGGVVGPWGEGFRKSVVERNSCVVLPFAVCLFSWWWRWPVLNRRLTIPRKPRMQCLRCRRSASGCRRRRQSTRS